MHFRSFVGSLMLAIAPFAVADLGAGVTITTAVASVQSSIESYISNYDHHTLGVNATVGSIITHVEALATAYPTPASVLQDFRSHINFISGPTPFFVDLESPSAVVASIASLMPTVEPFPEALSLISSVYDYLGSIASSELNGATSLSVGANATNTSASGSAAATTSMNSTIPHVGSASAAGTAFATLPVAMSNTAAVVSPLGGAVIAAAAAGVSLLFA